MDKMVKIGRPLKLLHSQAGDLLDCVIKYRNGIVDLATNLMILPSSTGGLERSFSVLGRIMTSIRNRLGVDKASKLCFIYSCLKSKDSSVT